MQKLKSVIKSFFGFSTRETNGFIWLSGIMLVLLFLPPLFSFFLASPDTSLADQKKLDSLLAVLNQPQSKTPLKEPLPGVLKKFNPNKENLESLTSLGLSETLARRIINYREKGGSFKTKKDLGKIYGMPDSLYTRLYSFIDLPDSLPSKANFTYKKEFEKSNAKRDEFKIANFDINTADSIELLKIKGIGNKLSSRIVNYRNKLGGFIHIDQLYEVYGLDSTVVTEMKKTTFVSSGFVPRFININASPFNELKSHPYLNLKYAKLIAAYRQQHGGFKSVEELKNLKELPSDVFKKIKPYLSN